MKFNSFLTVIFLFITILHAQDYEDPYYLQNTKNYFLKIGTGTGAAYGGWYGINTEINYGFISAVFGLGGMHAQKYIRSSNSASTNPKVQLGWQAGLRLYFLDKGFNLRPSLTVLYGPVYLYLIEYSYRQKMGVYNCITPSFIIDHDIGKLRKIGLTYGAGCIIHEKFPEIDNNIIEANTGRSITIYLSFIFGVHFYIF